MMDLGKSDCLMLNCAFDCSHDDDLQAPDKVLHDDDDADGNGGLVDHHCARGTSGFRTMLPRRGRLTAPLDSVAPGSM
jgi:hypothetical protein